MRSYWEKLLSVIIEDAKKIKDLFCAEYAYENGEKTIVKHLFFYDFFLGLSLFACQLMFCDICNLKETKTHWVSCPQENNKFHDFLLVMNFFISFLLGLIFFFSAIFVLKWWFLLLLVVMNVGYFFYTRLHFKVLQMED